MLAWFGGVDPSTAASASIRPMAPEIHPSIWLPADIASRPATVAGTATPACCAVKAAASPTPDEFGGDFRGGRADRRRDVVDQLRGRDAVSRRLAQDGDRPRQAGEQFRGDGEEVGVRRGVRRGRFAAERSRREELDARGCRDSVAADFGCRAGSAERRRHGDAGLLRRRGRLHTADECGGDVRAVRVHRRQAGLQSARERRASLESFEFETASRWGSTGRVHRGDRSGTRRGSGGCASRSFLLDPLGFHGHHLLRPGTDRRSSSKTRARWHGRSRVRSGRVTEEAIRIPRRIEHSRGAAG